MADTANWVEQSDGGSLTEQQWYAWEHSQELTVSIADPAEWISQQFQVSDGVDTEPLVDMIELINQCQASLINYIIDNVCRYATSTDDFATENWNEVLIRQQVYNALAATRELRYFMGTFEVNCSDSTALLLYYCDPRNSDALEKKKTDHAFFALLAIEDVFQQHDFLRATNQKPQLDNQSIQNFIRRFVNISESQLCAIATSEKESGDVFTRKAQQKGRLNEVLVDFKQRAERQLSSFRTGAAASASKYS